MCIFHPDPDAELEASELEGLNDDEISFMALTDAGTNKENDEFRRSDRSLSISSRSQHSTEKTSGRDGRRSSRKSDTSRSSQPPLTDPNDYSTEKTSGRDGRRSSRKSDTSRNSQPPLTDPNDSLLNSPREGQQLHPTVTFEKESTNAAFDAFKAALVTGIEVKKHRMNGEPVKGKLSSDSTYDTLFFKEARLTSVLRLSEIIQVRAGTDPDPEAPRFAGTAVLRKSCHPSNANKAMALITTQESLDFELKSHRECLEAVEFIRALVDSHIT